MPPVPDAGNLYAATGAGMLADHVAGHRPAVYVPANDGGFVTVIDPVSLEVVARHRVGRLIQHVVPAWDLGTLWANASGSNLLVPFDPVTAEPGEPVRVDAPYNLYFSPDGSQAIVMAERRNRIDVYDPGTWERIRSVDVPCDGPNHADWSIDGTWYLVTCEFSGQMLRVDTSTTEILAVIDFPAGARPQDVRVAPDGSAFYVADMINGGVWRLDGATATLGDLVPTGRGAHGLYPSRDARTLYVSNRDEGTVSVLDIGTLAEVDRWTIPGGGSPDMGGVSADGATLWLSGRNHDEVYVFDTTTGGLRARIPVPGGPHGLAVWPQPGRYSLGHTGNLR